MKTKTGKMMFSITLRVEDFEFLQVMCKKELRTKSQQIGYLLHRENLQRQNIIPFVSEYSGKQAR